MEFNRPRDRIETSAHNAQTEQALNALVLYEKRDVFFLQEGAGQEIVGIGVGHIYENEFLVFYSDFPFPAGLLAQQGENYT